MYPSACQSIRPPSRWQSRHFRALSAGLDIGSVENTLGYYLPTPRVLIFYDEPEKGRRGPGLSTATLHVLLHETSNKAIRNIIRECNRLLKKGGMMVHAETPPYKNLEPFDAFMLDWDTRNNNEPFWAGSHEIDLKQLSQQAGFDADKEFELMIPSALKSIETRRSKKFQGGDIGGGGLWFIYGNRK